MQVKCCRLAVLFITLTLIGSIITSGNAQIIHKGELELFYDFDKISGDTIEDQSDKGHTGKIFGNPERTEGKFNKSLFFVGRQELVQGQRQYIDTQDVLQLGGSDITVTMWVKVPPDSNDGGANRVGILFGNYNSPSNYNLELHGNGQVRTYWNNGQHDFKGKQDLRDDNWHHLTFVRDKEERAFRMYVDGELDGEFKGSAGADVNWQRPHRIAGDLRGDGSPWYNGAMDEFAVWDTVLDEDAIAKTMDAVLGVNDKALTLYYSFDDIQGKTVKDQSASKNEGKISGNPELIDGKHGDALFFAGNKQQLSSRQYIDIEGILPLGQGDITLCMWVKVPPDSNGGGGNRVGILVGNYNTANNFNVELHDNGQVRTWWNNGQHDYKGKQDLRDDEWHHLAFVRDKNKKKFIMYVNGKVDSEFGGATGDDVVWVAEHRVAGDLRGDDSPWYNGAMDDLAIWSVALAEKEIKQVMAGMNLSVSPEGKLSASWGAIKGQR